MDVQKANEDIQSINPLVRLPAARFFSSNPNLVAVDKLREFLLKETAPWIQIALLRAIEKADVSVVQQEPIVESTDTDINERLVNSIKAKAVEEVTGTILHEFSTVIGAINMQAPADFANYEGSKTSRLLNKLNELLKAIRSLKAASATPNYTDFSLSDLVDEILLTDEGFLENVKIHLVGPKPFLTSADRGQMLLAIVNGLRNASEAIKGFSTKQPPEVLITWGHAGSQDFLAIIDSGSGFNGNPSDALRIGVSSKGALHLGYGLATAQYAMRAMEGDLLVSNSLDGGARFELRWYKDNETAIS